MNLSDGMRSMTAFRFVLCIMMMAIMTACHRSGTWNDDPQNWERAFTSRKPADVIVVQSQFWRSSHFTYEYQYFFHIKRSDGLRAQLLEENRLRKIDGNERNPLFKDFFGKTPSWFIPESPDGYDVWVYESAEPGHFRIFIDKVSHDLFLTDYGI